MSDCYKLIILYEKGEWQQTAALSEKLGLKVEDLAIAYYEAIVWVNNIDVQ